MWRGDAYAEFAHEQWAMAESRRLGELRAGAVEDLAGLLLDGGDCNTAIATLEPHITTYPFRDRPRGLLMRALAGAGRRVDALRAFQDYRRFLARRGRHRAVSRIGRARSGHRQPSRAHGDAVDGQGSPHGQRQDRPRSPASSSPPDRPQSLTGVVDEFRRHHLSILRQALAVAGGSEVKTTGDGFMVVFDTAQRPCRVRWPCSRGSNATIAPRGTRSGCEWASAVGRVITEDDVHSGYPVVEAAQLCAASRRWADPGSRCRPGPGGSA